MKASVMKNRAFILKVNLIVLSVCAQESDDLFFTKPAKLERYEADLLHAEISIISTVAALSQISEYHKETCSITHEVVALGAQESSKYAPLFSRILINSKQFNRAVTSCFRKIWTLGSSLTDYADALKATHFSSETKANALGLEKELAVLEKTLDEALLCERDSAHACLHHPQYVRAFTQSTAGNIIQNLQDVTQNQVCSRVVDSALTKQIQEFYAKVFRLDHLNNVLHCVDLIGSGTQAAQSNTDSRYIARDIAFSSIENHFDASPFVMFYKTFPIEPQPRNALKSAYERIAWMLIHHQCTWAKEAMSRQDSIRLVCNQLTFQQALQQLEVEECARKTNATATVLLDRYKSLDEQIMQLSDQFQDDIMGKVIGFHYSVAALCESDMPYDLLAPLVKSVQTLCFHFFDALKSNDKEMCLLVAERTAGFLLSIRKQWTRMRNSVSDQ